MQAFGLDLAVNCSILFQELPLFERPQAAKRAGFEAVEFWWPFPTPTPDAAAVDAFIASIEDADVQLIGLNSFAGDMPAGERGILSHPDHADEFRANLEIVARIGARLEVPAFNVLFGNRMPGLPGPIQRRTAIENLKLASDVFGEFGATTLIEAVSGIPDYPLVTLADVFGVVDEAHASAAPNVGLLLDLYHLAANGYDPIESILDAGARAAHVQIADYPGRGAPGSGELDFTEIFEQLSVTYRGRWVALEYAASGSGAERFSWAQEREL
jgi:hydroxypyruvate isomerase